MFDEPVQINLIQGMQKQVGGVDCGRYIQYSYCYIIGSRAKSSFCCIYDQPSLRAHLVSCFEKLAMIPLFYYMFSHHFCVNAAIGCDICDDTIR